MAGYWFVLVLSWIICYIINGRTYKFYFSKNSVVQGVFHMLLDILGMSELFGRRFFCGTWWYMNAAILFIIIAPAIYRVMNRYGILLVAVICFTVPHLIGVEEVTSLNSFFLAFCIGMWLAKVQAFDRVREMKAYKDNPGLMQVFEFAVILLLLVYSYHLFLQLPLKIYWDVLRGILPLPFLFFSVKYVIRIPLLRTVLLFLGKHSMNIFLIHTFFRYYYASDFIYGLGNAFLIIVILLLISIICSIIIEVLKKISGYNKWMDAWSGKAL